MRNQTSFRLTTTLLPTDMTANTTTVINKVDSNGDKFYPHFLDVETVVLTNDDRTVMEITKARCNNGALTFEERGLDDKVNPVTGVEDSIPNRKLTRNPGTLAFITASAGDIIDKDGDIRWEGKQTYADDMTSMGKATYKGRLITEKGVEYPHFTNLTALEAYSSPFGGMFAVVDASGELYRYNAVTSTWSVVTTSTPAIPEQADDETIGTVRVATDAEFAAGDDTGDQGEYLMATVSQVKSAGGASVFTLTGTTDTSGGQAILDSVLAGGRPIIHYPTDSGNQNDFYVLDVHTIPNHMIVFTKVAPTFSGSTIKWKEIKITYSGTTLSNITLSERTFS